MKKMLFSTYTSLRTIAVQPLLLGLLSSLQLGLQQMFQQVVHKLLETTDLLLLRHGNCLLS